MALPELIEIVPLTKPVDAEITVPGSKSITNRALILAALANGETTIEGALWSEDTQVMVECLQKLGFTVQVRPDPEEFCNRSITVQGLAGRIPRAGTKEEPLELFVGNAGTAARFLSALVCLGQGIYRLHGVPRMHERPKAALFQALRELGYGVESPNDKLPVIIHGKGPRAGRCVVDIGESSQFASALLLCAKVGGWQVKVVGENAEESPYVAMTYKLIGVFPKNGGMFQIEPDASSGSYFWAVGCLWPDRASASEQTVKVLHWPLSDWQIDSRFPKFLPLPEQPVSRQRDLGDSIMTAIVIAPLASHATKFTELGRLRLQECERVVALRTESTKCGAQVVESGDSLEISPSPLHGAEIETYNDHRMAMCFAILGLKVAGIKIKNPACVKKTFPNFFQKLAAAAPAGLGASILDVKTGRALRGAELFAE
ncbi:MAG: 3-phosphoshikimate 1-carboxyvinyltransferase [Pedosphaera sp.]|nr:3-phosphoshikimate 1-carboxyvinyltransferase [Pedosphaera sp.]